MIHYYRNVLVRPLLNNRKSSCSYSPKFTTNKLRNTFCYQQEKSPISDMIRYTLNCTTLNSSIPVEILAKIEKYPEVPNEIQIELMKTYLLTLGLTSNIELINYAVICRENLLNFFLFVYSY